MELLANPVVSQFIGLLVGLFTSFFSWWMLFRWMAPTISISNSISRTPSSVSPEEDDDKSGARYRIKIENSGRRPAVDLQVSVFVRLKGLNDPQSTIWEVIHLPLATSGETTWTTPLMNPVRKSKLRTRLRICLNHTDYCAKPHFPEHIREKAARKALLLEDLLSLGTQAQVGVMVSGYDEFSGARKVFMKTYHLSDIKCGEFERKTLLIAQMAPNPAVEGTLRDEAAQLPSP